MIGLEQYIIVSSLLFSIGFFGVLLRKNTLVIYMCLELMLNAANLALVAFSRYHGGMGGNVFVFFKSNMVIINGCFRCVFLLK